MTALVVLSVVVQLGACQVEEPSYPRIVRKDDGTTWAKVRGTGRAPVSSWTPNDDERRALTDEVLRVAGEEGL